MKAGTKMVYVVLVGILSLALFTSCGHQETEKEKPEGRTFRAELFTITGTEVILFREIPGTVEARVRAKISSKVSGFIKEISVNEGRLVHRGDLLLRIEDRDLRERIKALQAELRATEKRLSQILARLAFARSEFERYRRLFKEEAVTAEELEARKADYEALLAQKAEVSARIKAGKARLAEVRSLLAYTIIRAPFEGQVVKKWVDAGSFVRPGELLLELEKRDGLEVVFHPEESLYQSLEIGKEIWAQFPAKNKFLKLRITEIVPEIDPQSRTFTVKASLPSGFDGLSGNYLRVFVPVTRTTKILIPQEALVNRDGFFGAFVVDKEGRVHFRVMRAGKTYYQNAQGFLPGCLEKDCPVYVEVLSGLKVGEKVVIRPPEGLREEDRIVPEVL